VTADGPEPRQLLADGVASLASGQQPDGALIDPVFTVPTQYGGAYFAWCATVLAERTTGTESATWRRRAHLGFGSALEHTADPAREPHASGFDRSTLSVVHRLNHRDFTWSPLMKVFEADASLAGRWSALVSSVEPERSFRSRPPSNWAAVWLGGEIRRMRAGLSSTSAEQLDSWLEVFFARPDGVGLHPGLGMYTEHGLPNAYDLFTRLHLTELLDAGYDGALAARLVEFLGTGLRRSLELQLSDGSMASGYRSAGQTWVLGAQIALFTLSDRLGLGGVDDRREARRSAWRAFDSLARWQRPDGGFAPVQNVLPAELRVGYETYTADGHYSPLALAMLATAVRAGFGDTGSPGHLETRPPTSRVEGGPVHRAAAHRGRISVGVLGQADDRYDATGLVDLTLGTGRRLHLVSAVRHDSGGPWLLPGLAVRAGRGPEPLTAVASLGHCCLDLRAGPGPSLDLTTALPAAPPSSAGTSAGLPPPAGASAGLPPSAGASTDGGPDDVLAGRTYGLRVVLHDDGIEVSESLSGAPVSRSLLLPYLQDLGDGTRCSVEQTPDGAVWRWGREWLTLRVEGTIERRSCQPGGFENRRGRCGLLRLDLADTGSVVRWRLWSGTAVDPRYDHGAPTSP
jgi:hypothetical protein